MARIQDVARDAGVSTATVSRVLSAPERVAEATRARVLAAVQRLGYAPNVAAKSLRTLKTGKILVTVPDISNPFFSQVIRGVEEAASAAGYSVLLGDTRHGVAGGHGRFLDAADHLREERVGDVGHRHQDLLGAQGAQHLGRDVRRIAQPVHGGHHPGPRGRRHPVRRAQHARHRRGGDSGVAGDILDRGHWSSCARFRFV